MARRFFKKFVPHREKVSKDRWMQMFSHLLHRHELWHLNRMSVARAVAIGIFWCVIPIPMQSIPSVACAIFCRANVALAFAMVWLSNPITLVPHWWLIYEIGRIVLGRPRMHIEYSTDWLMENLTWHTFQMIYFPMLLGSVILGIVLAALGYVLSNMMWRFYVAYRWSRRREAMAA
jgi:uncharacterized protein (DUF2062 family)